VRVFLEMVKFSHSIFALPFALAAAFLAAEGWLDALLALKVILACVLARTAAMAFNRWADRHLDARNPRTAGRALPAGLLTATSVLTASILSAAGFVAVAAWINTLALALSPLALAVLLGYSYTKRFTAASHLVLGAALGLSPIGAWIAVRGRFDLLPCLLGAAVLFWTAGFDTIYACQDAGFDRRQGLHSMPQRWGVARALWVARGFHAAALGFLGAAGASAGLGAWYALGVLLVAALLVYEHSLVRADDLSRIDVAFFTLNGMVSIAFLGATMLEVLL
jgi:4-hydroxybenzoate polyprenyltransferase